MSFEMGAVLTAVVAGLVGWIGLHQYMSANRWKRAEFAVSQARMLVEDDTLAFCCRAIDWGVGPLIVPEKYRVLVGGASVVDHDWQLMAKALRANLAPGWDTPETKGQFLLYRHCFDEFFSYLDRILEYQHLGVIRPENLSLIDDYIVQLRDPRYWPETTAGIARKDVFGEFLRAYYPRRVWPWVRGKDQEKLV